MDLFKTFIGTCLGMSLSSYISSMQHPPPIIQRPPTTGERIIRIVEHNPRMIIDPVINGTGKLYTKVFHNQRDKLVSHPIPVDSEGREVVPHRNIQVTSSSFNKEKWLNLFGYTILSITCITAIAQMAMTKKWQ